MEPPPHLDATTDAVSVSDFGRIFDRSFSLGGARVTHVSFGPETASRYGGLFGFHAQSESAYSYDFERGDGTFRGECVVAGSTDAAHLGKVTVTGRAVHLGCACGDGEASPEALLSVEGLNGDLSGTLSAAGGPTYHVSSLRELQGGGTWNVGPAGYRVDSGDGIVGAVDVLPPGHVWIAKHMEVAQRDRVECVFAGLLLFTPPTD